MSSQEAKDHYQKYKTYQSNYSKEYYLNNKENLQKQSKENYEKKSKLKYTCGCSNKEIKFSSYENHIKTKKHIKYIESLNHHL